jgi:regulator of PEP synthase PpsR (kinase-PPPase family)
LRSWTAKAATDPLIQEDFERDERTSAPLPGRRKLFGLSAWPERMAAMRHERPPENFRQ